MTVTQKKKKKKLKHFYKKTGLMILKNSLKLSLLKVKLFLHVMSAMKVWILKMM